MEKSDATLHTPVRMWPMAPNAYYGFQSCLIYTRAIYLANQLSSMQLCQQNKKKQNILNVSKQISKWQQTQKDRSETKVHAALKIEKKVHVMQIN